MTQLGHRLSADDFDDSRAVSGQTVGAGGARLPGGSGPDAARVARHFIVVEGLLGRAVSVGVPSSGAAAWRSRPA